MRHVLAILLSVVVSFPLIAPLLAKTASAGAGKLPACCRRDGKHGCGMKSMAGAAALASKTSGPAVRGQKFRCAQYPADSSAPPTASRLALTAAVAGVGLPPVMAAPAATPWRESHFASVHASLLPQRGPPASL
ncbi:MAG: hypothetical protein IT162_02685 [Bryobacterales bacterium]|nr:hypothetical protein [Bryobacterales bacterium]